MQGGVHICLAYWIMAKTASAMAILFIFFIMFIMFIMHSYPLVSVAILDSSQARTNGRLLQTSPIQLIFWSGYNFKNGLECEYTVFLKKYRFKNVNFSIVLDPVGKDLWSVTKSERTCYHVIITSFQQVITPLLERNYIFLETFFGIGLGKGF